MKSARAGISAAILVISLLTVAPEARAYLDPSTGSMILSAIVGLLATVTLAVKTYWYKLRALFRGGRPGKPDEPTRKEDQGGQPVGD